MALGLLIIRLAVGLTLAAHGAQKLFGIFGGHGLTGTAGFLESIGFRPGKPLALLAGVAELCGGLALALGLFTPFAAAVVIATMIVAVLSVHFEKGFFSQNGGYELALVLALSALGVAFAGPGPVSLDAALGLSLSGNGWGIVALALGVMGAAPPMLARALAARRRAST
jgi:putative oxidoreductase